MCKKAFRYSFFVVTLLIEKEAAKELDYPKYPGTYWLENAS